MRQLIAILRGIAPDEAADVAQVLVEAGITIIEVPMNSPRPFVSIERMAKAVADRARIGGGTILEPGQVDRLADAGGTFTVSPDCNPAVIERTKAKGLAAYPGVFSPSEFMTGIRYGADGLKLFPAFVMGLDGLKAISAVLPDETQVFAVGGVDGPQFADWFAAGAAGFGIGSSLYKPGAELAGIAANARLLVDAYDAASAGD